MSQIIEPHESNQQLLAPTERKAVGTDSPVGSRDRFAPLWTWNWRHFAVVLVFGLFFLFNNYLRLFYSDIWGHVAYGNWILDHQALPTQEPFVKLAEGMPLMCTAWGSQILLALGGRLGGPEAYSAMFAVSVTLTYLILARVCYLQTRSIGLSVFAALLAWGVNWGRHAVIRPEMFGGLCFAALIWLVVRSDRQRSRKPNEADVEPSISPTRRVTLWIGVPVVFLLWANLHGSFVVGFAVLGSYALGRGVEVLWRERQFGALLSDRLFRRWVLLTEVAVLASLVNPYGFDLLLHTALFPSHPNLADVIEWFPLEMVSVEGVTVGGSWLLLLVLLRHSRARVAVSDGILLAVFSLAVCLRVRMVAWYGPIWMLAIAPHLKDVFDQLKSSALAGAYDSYDAWASRGSSRIFLFSALATWLAFVFSPVSTFVLDAKPRDRSMQYHGDTPLGITDYLRENPPEGLVANPQWWGDWLVWKGPSDLQVLMTTNAIHVVPPRVWRDYLVISAGDSGWESRLAKYRINTLIVDKKKQADLHRAIRQHLGWKIVYEDDLGLVAVRKRMLESEDETTAGVVGN